MSLASPALRSLLLRRSIHARPIKTPLASLPPTFIRQVTVQSSPSDSAEHPDPSTYSFHAASSSSNHPYASIDSPLGPSPSPSGPSSDAGPSTQPSEETRSISVVANLPAPEPSHPFRARGLAHPFDSYGFVQALKGSTFESMSAQALMEAVRSLIVDRGDKSAEHMLSQEDRENQAYLFRAALAELRTELSVRARNDSLALKAMSGAIRREVDQLEQKMKEEMETLRHDIELDTNNRKSETRSELKGFNLDIEEINNKFTISLGDLRTEIETAKWEQTRRAVAAIIFVLVSSVTIFVVYKNQNAKKAQPAPVPEPKAVMRDMAVGTDEDLLEDLNQAVSDETLERLLHQSGLDDIDATAKKVRSRAGSKSRVTLDVDKI